MPAQKDSLTTSPPKRLGFNCGSWGNNPDEDHFEIHWPGLPKTSTLQITISSDKIEIGGPNFYVEGAEYRPECNSVILKPGIVPRTKRPQASEINSALVAALEEAITMLKETKWAQHHCQCDVDLSLPIGSPGCPRVDHLLPIRQALAAAKGEK